MRSRQRGSLDEEEKTSSNGWRGCAGRDSQLGQIKVFPRAHGPATNVVVTEYEAATARGRLDLGYDVSGDSKGNILVFEPPAPSVLGTSST